MDGGHKSLLDVELVVNSLDHGCKTVGGTGCAGNEVLRSIIFSLVDSHDNGQGIILGRSRVDNLLSSSVNDSLSLLLGEENSGGLTNVVSSECTPANFLGVTATGGHDLLSVKNKEVSIDLNSLLGDSVNGIVLVLVSHVVGGSRSSIDSVHLAVLISHDDTGNKTSDTSESVNSHSSDHLHVGSIGGSLECRSREGAGGECSSRSYGSNKSSNRKLHFYSVVNVVGLTLNEMV
mmetsp:Transcript_16621/g.31483  ORF Transcript_16621/g.31483 Transcript_16621/m.31483 type:complete len:234 (+) Transcript_16621:634-1335(+)